MIRVRDLFVIAFGATLAIAMLFVAITARADAPSCTGDRHLDECGYYCPVTTTTTTLPDTGGKCPDVECKCDGATYNVTVNRCPDVPRIDRIDRCHYNRKSGKVVCPNKDFPRRMLVPRYEEN